MSRGMSSVHEERQNMTVGRRYREAGDHLHGTGGSQLKGLQRSADGIVVRNGNHVKAGVAL